jgi:hypothetical protein
VTIDVNDPAGPEPGVSVLEQAAAPQQRSSPEPTSRRGGRPPRPAGRARALLALLPLLLVLAVQAALSLRLANTAFEDEAFALFTGHQEIRVLFHAASGTPDFAAYFSAAPFLYPVPAAAADAHFGLAGARLLSLMFMLGATALLWSSTRALFGRAAAVGAVLVFGLAGPTLFLGHFAVYDVPAVFLYAASLRIVIGTARQRSCTVLFAVPTTVLAIATSYASALFLPVLALVAVFCAAAAAPPGARRRGDRLRHLGRGLLLAGTVGAVTVGWLTLLGPSYRQGLERTLTGRLVGTDSLGSIVDDSLQWGAVALVLGLLGTLAVVGRHRADPRDRHNVAAVLLTLTLAGSVMLAPAYQAHIHTLQSLQKHIDLGLLFASVAAGVAVSVPLRAAWRAPTRYGVVAGAAAVLAVVGSAQSSKLFGYWADSTALTSELKRDMGAGGGHYLAETSSVPQYYTARLADGDRNDWQNTYSFAYRDSAGRFLSGPPAYRQAIAEHYFKLIVLSHSETPGLDAMIDARLEAHQGYRLVSVVPDTDVFGSGTSYVWEAES